MVGGSDTFIEDLYFYIGPAVLKRDYNVLLVDLSGQGRLPFDGLPMGPDAEVPIEAVVDYVLGRSEVDSDRLGAYGISGSGYLVPRSSADRESARPTCALPPSGEPAPQSLAALPSPHMRQSHRTQAHASRVPR